MLRREEAPVFASCPMSHLLRDQDTPRGICSMGLRRSLFDLVLVPVVRLVSRWLAVIH